MIFVFEGVERSGKTTLAKQVSMRLNIPIINLPRPSSLIDQHDQGKIDAETAFNRISYTSPHAIMDRFIVSELVYSTIFKRKSDRQWYLNLLHQHLKDIAIIHVIEPISIIKDRWKHDDKMLNRDPATIPIIMQEFDHILKKLPHLAVYTIRPSSPFAFIYLLDWMEVQLLENLV